MSSLRPAVVEKMVFRETPRSRVMPSVDHTDTLFCANATAKPKTQSVPALERALNILECLANSQHGVTHSQLTRRLQLPRSTCHALLLTFERCGYMERDNETGRYRLGFKLYTVANKALSGIRLRDQAAPILHQLGWETGLTVHLAVFVENEVVLIAKIGTPGTPKIATWVGKRLGLHCTALGKALIAHLPEDKVDELVLKHGLLRHNENTITSTRKLRLACETVRQLGYAVDDEEEEIGVRCIAAPVLDCRRQVVASIGISGATTQIENVATVASQVRKAATILARQLALAGDEDHASVDQIQVPALVGFSPAHAGHKRQQFSSGATRRP